MKYLIFNLTISFLILILLGYLSISNLSKGKNVSVRKTTSLLEDDIVIGNKNANILIFEYSDPDCPYCKDLWDKKKVLFKEFEGNIAFVYRFFPLTSLHGSSLDTSYAFYCAYNSSGVDGFIKFGDEYYKEDNFVNDMKNYNQETKDRIYAKVAKNTGLDANYITNCVRQSIEKKKIANDIELGLLKGVSITPTTFIIIKNKEIMVPGATYSKIRRILTYYTK